MTKITKNDIKMLKLQIFFGIAFLFGVIGAIWAIAFSFLESLFLIIFCFYCYWLFRIFYFNFFK